MDVHESIEKDVEGRINIVSQLEGEIIARKKLQKHLSQQLLAASRAAGMAEVATGVLHNVGNVLNSVSVSSELLIEKVNASQCHSLERVVELLNQNKDCLAEFLSQNAKGEKITQFLAELSNTLANEQAAILKELSSLRKNIYHLCEVVSMQQSFASFGGVTQDCKVSDLVNDAIQLSEGSNNVHIIIDLDFAETVRVDKHCVLQVLINLISNAKHAVGANSNCRITVRSFEVSADEFAIEVNDTGQGIAKENLTRIFAHGYSTKKDGHGFGLHSSANVAKEIGGHLSVKSEGLGKGACFQLRLPKDADCIQKHESEESKTVLGF